MGLDMFLNAKQYFWTEDKPELDCIPYGYELEEISVRAAYWRKANAIHDWFVQNVQEGVDNCGEYDVSREQLRSLLEACQSVLNKDADPSDVLPTSEGFFFGSTEYDDWYTDNLISTVDELTAVLKDFPEGKWFFTYRASW